MLELKGNRVQITSCRATVNAVHRTTVLSFMPLYFRVWEGDKTGRKSGDLPNIELTVLSRKKETGQV